MVLTSLSLRFRPTLVQGLFALVAPLCGIGSLSLSGQLLQQHLSRDIWRHIFLIWLPLHNCLHTQLSVDVLDRILDFRFGTLICLVRHALSLASAGNIGKYRFDLLWFIYTNLFGSLGGVTRLWLMIRTFSEQRLTACTCYFTQATTCKLLHVATCVQ